MIKLQDSDIRQIVPQHIRNDPRVQALGYAMHRQMAQWMQTADLTGIYDAIDKIPDAVLDLLAVELRAPYYDAAAMSTDRKREAIKNALYWHYHAGTLRTVQELVEFVWGPCKVLEWFQYGGAPYTFEIELFDLNNIIADDPMNAFLAALMKVKNTRSWLTAIRFHRRADLTVHTGSAEHGVTRQVIIDYWVDSYTDNIDLHTGAAAVPYTRQSVVDYYRVSRRSDMAAQAAVATVQTTRQTIKEA
ncbi:MAG: phage tail protein I [Eubacteriales bacterium]|nr:phage tail protein I [Eubacteriales bacterium]